LGEIIEGHVVKPDVPVVVPTKGLGWVEVTLLVTIPLLIILLITLITYFLLTRNKKRNTLDRYLTNVSTPSLPLDSIILKPTVTLYQ
jgi:hypothetical protein